MLELPADRKRSILVSIMTAEAEELLTKARNLAPIEQAHIGIALTQENPDVAREMNALEEKLTDRLSGPFKPIPENWAGDMLSRAKAELAAERNES